MRKQRYTDSQFWLASCCFWNQEFQSLDSPVATEICDHLKILDMALS